MRPPNAKASMFRQHTFMLPEYGLSTGPIQAQLSMDITSDLRFLRSEEHTSELQSLMRSSYAVFCLKKKKTHDRTQITNITRDRSTLLEKEKLLLRLQRQT